MKSNIRKGLETLLKGNQSGKTRNTGITPRTTNTNAIWDERQGSMYDPAKILNDAINRALGIDNTTYDLPGWLKQTHADYESGRIAQQSPAATLGSKIIKPTATAPKIRPDGWIPDGFRQLTEALKQGWQPDETTAAARLAETTYSSPFNTPIQEPSREYRPGDVTPMRRLVQRRQNELNNPENSLTGENNIVKAFTTQAKDGKTHYASGDSVKGNFKSEVKKNEPLPESKDGTIFIETAPKSKPSADDETRSIKIAPEKSKPDNIQKWDTAKIIRECEELKNHYQCYQKYNTTPPGGSDKAQIGKNVDNVPSIYGPVDLDWLLTTVGYSVEGVKGMPTKVYKIGKAAWNAGRKRKGIPVTAPDNVQEKNAIRIAEELSANPERSLSYYFPDWEKWEKGQFK